MSAEELRAKIREVPDFPKPGILFYDITTLLKDPAAYKESIDLMLAPYAGEQIDLVVGMESRGFIFSAPMAYQLDAGLVPVRKLGKLPAETITVEYALEYGSNTLEIHRDAISPGQQRAHRRRPARDRRHGQRHDRARRAAEGRGRRPRLPGRARLPQRPRPPGWTPGDQRHPVLTAGRSEVGPLADHPANRERPGRSRPGIRRGRRADAGGRTAMAGAASGAAASAAPARRRRRRHRSAPPGPEPISGGAGSSALRRRVIQTAATVAGAAQALQRASAEAASAILDPAAAAGLLGTAPASPQPPPAAAPTGFRTPFREDGGVALPDRPAPAARRPRGVSTAGPPATSSYAIREMIVRGAPGDRPGGRHRPGALGRQDARQQPYARRATLRGAPTRSSTPGPRPSTCAGRSTA